MKSFFGVLALIALAVAIVVGVLQVFVPASPSVKTQSKTVTAEQAGQPLKAGDISWAVNGIRQTVTINTHRLPPETRHGNFLVINFTVMNTSDVPATLTPASAILISGDGYRKQADPIINPGYVEYKKDLLFTVNGLLEPGESRSGKVNFDLGPVFNADPGKPASIKLQLGDTDPTTKNEKTINLQVAPLSGS